MQPAVCVRSVKQAESTCNGTVEHTVLGLDGVKRFFVARKLIALEQAAFLAGRTGAHVRLRERL